MMPQHDNEILANELSLSGRRKLVSFVVKFLPNDVHQIVVEVAGNASIVLQAVVALLKSEGEVLEIINGDDIPVPEKMRVKALICSGFLNMNPAIVTVDIGHIGNIGHHPACCVPTESPQTKQAHSETLSKEA